MIVLAAPMLLSVVFVGVSIVLSCIALCLRRRRKRAARLALIVCVPACFMLLGVSLWLLS